MKMFKNILTYNKYQVCLHHLARAEY